MRSRGVKRRHSRHETSKWDEHGIFKVLKGQVAGAETAGAVSSEEKLEG